MRLPINPELRELPVYQPGRPIEEVAREIGFPASDIIKLASNENPLGPSPRAIEAVKKFLPQLHLYPDGNAFYLKEKLASRLRVAPQNLIVGNGSNEIIEFVAHALLKPGDNIVVSQYCFAVYPLMARLFGAEVVSVPSVQFGHDWRAMVKAVNARTRILFVANPNNPTGTVIPPGEIRELVQAVPPQVLLVMDEAYIEFLEGAADLLPIIRDQSHPNLILMRTFSKIYGLAGLRAGYGIAHPELVAALEKVRQPFNLNAAAQVAANAALDDHEHIQKTRLINQKGLHQLSEGFQDLGLKFVPSYANFILVRVSQGQRTFEDLQRKGVIVRPMGGYHLPEWIRISVGTEAENARCLGALKKSLY